jgi:hypothetical protein
MFESCRGRCIGAGFSADVVNNPGRRTGVSDRIARSFTQAEVNHRQSWEATMLSFWSGVGFGIAGAVVLIQARHFALRRR